MRIIERKSPLFPEKLKSITPIVEKLYVEGNYKILNNFGIAIVGSRNASKDGEKITDEIVEKLSEYNINIISGLAIGIDSRAHKTCINNKGKTIAVIGSGFKHIYPPENKKLFEKIIEQQGAIITEYEPKEEVNSKNFPKRNRIVSGLSDGILVIEGKYGSGTSITARLGIKQNKPIFCIPHSVYNKYGTIPNDLIKQGAKLVTSAKDILQFYEEKDVKLEKRKQNKKYESDILKLLSKETLTKEELSQKMNKSIAQINQEITILELEGLITESIEKGYKIIE